MAWKVKRKPKTCVWVENRSVVANGFCECGCLGKTSVIKNNEKKRGYVKGQFMRFIPGHSSRRHGNAIDGERTPTYRSWMAMWERTTRVKHPAYKHYGGRGIAVCNRWAEFKNFLSDMGFRPEGKTLDRINNDRGYYPSNCRWATLKDQVNNSRKNHFVVFNGQKQTIAQWAEKLGILKTTLRMRLESGWPIERVLTMPVRSYSRKIKVKEGK